MTIKRQKVAVLKTLEILEVYIVNKRGDELLMVIHAIRITFKPMFYPSAIDYNFTIYTLNSLILSSHEI